MFLPDITPPAEMGGVLRLTLFLPRVPGCRLGPSGSPESSHTPSDAFSEPSTTSPLLALAKLMASLGGVLTRAARNTPHCLAKMTVALLRPNLERRIFGVANGTSDAAVAFHLKTFLLDINLPPMFASRSARPTDVQRDLSDAIRYSFGTDEDRIAVETARLSSANGCATAPSPA